MHLQGIVTHVTDVKPLVEVVTYTDQENGNEVYQEVRGERGERGEEEGERRGGDGKGLVMIRRERRRVEEGDD